MTEHDIEFVTFLPTDIYPAYVGYENIYPPEDPVEERLFDQARIYDASHRLAPKPLRAAFQMPREALEWAQEGQDTDLLLWGHVGVGKSHSAVATGTLRAGLELCSFAFHPANKSLRVLKNYSDREAMEEMRADLTRPEILVFDDIGREKFNEPDVANMTELLDERQAKGRVSIFTTNLHPKSLKDYFGDHLTSRLVGGARMIQVTGRDRRVNP
jgi:DNA replication protein DnaC